MQETDEPLWLLLPPQIRARIEERLTADRALSPNLMDAALTRVNKNPVRKRQLETLAHTICDYLADHPKGWGVWPQDTSECLYVGLCLGTWFTKDIERILLDLSPRHLAFLEEECRQSSTALEQYIFDRMTENREADL